jgi:anti-sigma B factor antagonist
MTDSVEKTDGKKVNFRISASGSNGYVEVVGPGNMNIAPVLKDICYAMIGEQKSTIVVNLKHCEVVDSTFMGTLVNIHERFEAMGVTGGKLLLINRNADHKRLFDMVGVSTLLPAVKDDVEVPTLELKDIDASDVNRAEKLRVVVEAHEKLIQLNEGNKEKFDKFLAIVRGEMKEDGIIKDE